MRLYVCPGRTRRRVAAPTADPTTWSDNALGREIGLGELAKRLGAFLHDQEAALPNKKSRAPRVLGSFFAFRLLGRGGLIAPEKTLPVAVLPDHQDGGGVEDRRVSAREDANEQRHHEMAHREPAK